MPAVTRTTAPSNPWGRQEKRKGEICHLFIQYSTNIPQIPEITDISARAIVRWNISRSHDILRRMSAVAKTRATRKLWPKFIAAIAATGNVREAARQSGVDRVAAYRKRWREPKFAAQWEEAELLAVELLEDEARRRAHDGVAEPVFYKGEECGAVQKYSDTLLIFLLKGAKPTKYRDNQAVQQLGADGRPIDPAAPVSITLVSYGTPDSRPASPQIEAEKPSSSTE